MRGSSTEQTKLASQQIAGGGHTPTTVITVSVDHCDVSSVYVRLQSLQRAVAQSLFLVTVATGVVVTGTSAAVAYSPEGTRAYPNRTVTVAGESRFEGLQAQFPDRRDRIENNRDRWEDYRQDEVRRCLNKRDRDDREECLEDLKRDRQRDYPERGTASQRDRRFGRDDARRCFEKRDEDDRRRCLRNLRNRHRDSERERWERRDDLYDRLERDRRFPF